MSKVIGQRWEIYDYNGVKDTPLKKGEKVFVKNTPDFKESVVELVSNAKDRTIEELYTDWKNGVGSPWESDLSYMLSLLIYTTDMRNIEIERIRLSDFNMIEQYHFLNVPDSKTINGIRIVPIHNFVYDKLMEYAKKYNKNDYIFKTKGKRLGSIVYRKSTIELAKHLDYSAEDIDKENIRFYSGRHFWKTLMSGEELGDIEEFFMGHKVSSDVAKRYNHRDKLGKEKLLEKTKKVFEILDKYIFM